MSAQLHAVPRRNIAHWQERLELAAAFRWAARLDLHEAVSNHFSLVVEEQGPRFLINPNQVHFSRVRASDLLLLDAGDPDTPSQPGAPDPTAWGLHASLHRRCPHARCAMHVHSIHATVLACLSDSTLPPIDFNTATFYGRYAVDDQFGGLALEEEGERCTGLLADPKVKVLILGNHGVLVIGDSVADTFNRLYFFERAAETCIRALQTGRPLRVLSPEIAERTARQIETYPGQADRHFAELKAILDEEGDSYSS